METIRVYREEVLENLKHFRTFLKKHPALDEGRSYPALLDCRTGTMYFATATVIPSPAAKEIAIVAKKTPGQRIYFEIEGASLEELDMMVQKIALETLYVLNCLRNVHQILKSTSKVRIISSKERIESMPGWCNELCRMGAERTLRYHPIGTYILREGEPPLPWLIRQYAHTEGYVLTVVEKDKKISDYLLLRTEAGWTLRRDEPDLSLYHYFPSLRDLLRQMKKIARRPFVLKKT